MLMFLFSLEGQVLRAAYQSSASSKKAGASFVVTQNKVVAYLAYPGCHPRLAVSGLALPRSHRFGNARWRTTLGTGKKGGCNDLGVDWSRVEW
jgi:hypothetical protein